MKYPNIKEGVFVNRCNRFVAEIEIDGAVQKCHVKNTGRLRELLVPGAVCYLTGSDNPKRATRYDLVAVQKGLQVVNIDSMAPNQVAYEYLSQLYPNARIHKESVCGNSRLDFLVENGTRKLYIEVKGVTLREKNAAKFPDAPTLRGVKHIRELIACKKAGHDAMLLFVVAMTGVDVVIPNRETQPEFEQALREAKAAGVQLLAVDCVVTSDSICAQSNISVLV